MRSRNQVLPKITQDSPSRVGQRLRLHNPHTQIPKLIALTALVKAITGWWWRGMGTCFWFNQIRSPSTALDAHWRVVLGLGKTRGFSQIHRITTAVGTIAPHAFIECLRYRIIIWWNERFKVVYRTHNGALQNTSHSRSPEPGNLSLPLNDTLIYSGGRVSPEASRMQLGMLNAFFFRSLPCSVRQMRNR